MTLLRRLARLFSRRARLYHDEDAALRKRVADARKAYPPKRSDAQRFYLNRVGWRA